MGNCCGTGKQEKAAKAGPGARGTGAPAAGAGGDFFVKVGGKKAKKDEGPTEAYTVRNKEDFNNQLALAGDKLVVVDFYATWCGPCKLVKPKIDEMSIQMKQDNVIFLKVDVDECDEVATAYGISSMPTFVLIKDSERLDEMSGVNLDRLMELIANNKPKGEPSEKLDVK